MQTIIKKLKLINLKAIDYMVSIIMLNPGDKFTGHEDMNLKVQATITPELFLFFEPKQVHSLNLMPISIENAGRHYA